MAHKHNVIDNDVHFIIDPITREIKDQSTTKKVIVQNDHNSERITFAIPRNVENHDMMSCDKIEIHYKNISTDKKNKSEDIYCVDDVHVDTNSDAIVVFSWLLSRNATRYAGHLEFSIRFACLTGEEIDYDWHTGVCKALSVAEGINNTETMVENNPDLLEGWKNSVDERIDDINAILETLVEGA